MLVSFMQPSVMTALREAGVDVSPEKMQEVLSGKGNFLDQINNSKGEGEDK
jgi:hypothetical protein